MRWPDRIKGKTVCKEMVSAMALLPTLAGITGAKLPGWALDGRNILPLLEGRPEAASPRDALYFYDGTELQAVRSGAWKLHLPHGYRTITQPGTDGQSGQEETRDLPLSLFSLEEDPGETVNLADQYPEVMRRLREAAQAFDTDIKNNQRPIGQICEAPTLCGSGN